MGGITTAAPGRVCHSALELIGQQQTAVTCDAALAVGEGQAGSSIPVVIGFGLEPELHRAGRPLAVASLIHPEVEGGNEILGPGECLRVTRDLAALVEETADGKQVWSQ